MNRVPCRGCGRPIVFGTLPNGKRVPLDPSAPVYAVSEDGTCDRVQGVMVSHFSTCSKANDFSASKRGSDPDDATP